MPISIERDEFSTLIKFGPPGTTCKGRNGLFSSIGYDIAVDNANDTFELHGVTARNGYSSALRLSVPKDAWVGAALDALLDDLGKRKQLPGCLGLHPLLDLMVADRLQKGRVK